MVAAIIEIDDLSKLFADLAPLYVAKPVLEQWLAKHELYIASTENGYRIIVFDSFKDTIEPLVYYPTYSEALVIALDKCIAKAKAE